MIAAIRIITLGLIAAPVAIFATAPLTAQDLPVRLTGRVGMSRIDGNHGGACGYSFPSIGVEFRTRGAIHLVAATEVYTTGGGLTLGCSPRAFFSDSTIDHATGGLEFEAGGATRFMAGAGGRLPVGWASFEFTVGGGLTRAGSVRGSLHPWVGAMAGVSLLGDHLVVGWDWGMNRVPVRHEIHPWPQPHDPSSNLPPNPGEEPYEVVYDYVWGRISGVTVGLRF